MSLKRVMWVCLFMLGFGCESTPAIQEEGEVVEITNIYYNTYITPSTDASEKDVGEDMDAGPSEYISHLPDCATVVPLSTLAIDLFGMDGHQFYIEVHPEQRDVGDMQICNQKFGFPNGVYTLEGDSADALCPNWAYNIRIIPAGQTSSSVVCADTGKVELDLVGQSSWRPWSDIPNFKVDTGEFLDQAFLTDKRRFRLNNGQADSGIPREAITLRVWKAMGYPAPESSFARTQSNVWDTEYGEGTWAAHVLREQYDKRFFETHLPDVTQVWEGSGDPFMGWFEADCQWSHDDKCNDAWLADIVALVQSTPMGPGFMAATESVIDWPALHQNQCLAALTATGDDWIHNMNNVVLALTEKGQILFLPYSVDISAGHLWFPFVPYDGFAFLADMCRQDPDCRKNALTTCLEMIGQFEALDVPQTIVDERCDALEDAGLMRPSDESICKEVRQFYIARPNNLKSEIEMLIFELENPKPDEENDGEPPPEDDEFPPKE